jgi:hypothetical protein
MSHAIQNLYDSLRVAGYKAWLVQDQAQLPPRVFCETLVDDRGRPLVFEIMFTADMTAVADGAPEADDVDDAFQMFLISLQLPIALEQAAFAQAYRLFNVLNTLLPLGTYLINEDGPSMHLKAAVPCMGEPSNAAAMEVLDMLTSFVTQTAPIIEKVCSGAVALEEAVAQMQAAHSP